MQILQVPSVVVVKAFIDRIKEVNSLINAVVDDRMEQALMDAIQVDEFLKTCTWSEKDLETKKPFLGVPFTTKESTECGGTARWLNSPNRMSFQSVVVSPVPYKVLSVVLMAKMKWIQC